MEMDNAVLADRITALEENEMQLFRMMLDRPAGAILTVDTDMMLAQLLEADGLMTIEEGGKVIIPAEIRDAYRDIWSDELTLRWRKRNWMYKCLEAGRYLYGVMTWEALRDLFALRYPHAYMDEIRELFGTTPAFFQWFNELDGKLVLNGYEKDDYYKYLERMQEGIDFYVPTREEVEELYNRGCLLSRESHAKLKDFIAETFGCGDDAAEVKTHELYEAVNNRIRVNDVVDSFTEEKDGVKQFEFPSDEAQVKFIELYMEMSRECRTRDNRGHDWYEMTSIMASKNRKPAAEEKKTQVKRVKIGRNEPCPCGSGKKYKNCCGR